MEPITCSYSRSPLLHELPSCSYAQPLTSGPSQAFRTKNISYRKLRSTYKIQAVSDPELQSVLDLASDAELSELSDILYGPSLFSPLLKSVTPGDGARMSHKASSRVEQGTEGRESIVDRLASRFFFLAADAKATLSGRRPTYRDVLLGLRTKLNISCSEMLSTEDMEAEIFLYLLQEETSNFELATEPLWDSEGVKYANAFGASKVGGWHGFLATMKLSTEDLLSLFVKGGSVLTMSTLQKFVSRKLCEKVVLETARYQLAKETLIKGGLLAARLESQVATLQARQLLAKATARYFALRGTTMLLGPLLWGSFMAELVIKALGTDHARVVRAIYAFAQIRLTRTHGWTKPEL